MRVPFSKRPDSATYMHMHGDGVITMETVFDREPILDHAAIMRNEVRQRGSLKKVMTVPAALIHQWIREGKLGEESFVGGACLPDSESLAKLFNDPDNALLRCVDKL